MNTLPVNPRIAVIILTVNQRDQTLRCLEHLRADHDTAQDFSITVWDNGSHDDTVAAIRKADPATTVLISETNLGVAGGRNAAAKAIIERNNPDLFL